jgi:beta-glucosidase-like glycosyl hydrolase
MARTTDAMDINSLIKKNNPTVEEAVELCRNARNDKFLVMQELRKAKEKVIELEQQVSNAINKESLAQEMLNQAFDGEAVRESYRNKGLE